MTGLARRQQCAVRTAHIQSHVTRVKPAAYACYGEHYFNGVVHRTIETISHRCQKHLPSVVISDYRMYTFVRPFLWIKDGENAVGVAAPGF